MQILFPGYLSGMKSAYVFKRLHATNHTRQFVNRQLQPLI